MATQKVALNHLLDCLFGHQVPDKRLFQKDNLLLILGKE